MSCASILASSPTRSVSCASACSVLTCASSQHSSARQRVKRPTPHPWRRLAPRSGLTPTTAPCDALFCPRLRLREADEGRLQSVEPGGRRDRIWCVIGPIGEREQNAALVTQHGHVTGARGR